MRSRVKPFARRWKAEALCPLCVSTLAWIAFGGASAGGLSALLFARRRKGQDDGDVGNDTPDRDA
jgi:hypothetical protein